MTPTVRALLATARDNPGDTTARKVYADALHDAADEYGALKIRLTVWWQWPFGQFAGPIPMPVEPTEERK